MTLLTTIGWAAAAVLLTAVQLVIVARHPEPPADEPDIEFKPRYADLVRPATVAAALVAALLCALPAVALVPANMRGAWLVWSSAALVLVGVDALTTWLPIRASHFTAVGLTVAVLVAGFSPDKNLALTSADVDGWLLLRAAAGAALAGGLFALVWSLTRAIGFGDVRLAAMTGGLTGMWSIELWCVSLLAGSLAAACWGLVVQLWRRRHPSPLGAAFAYGPGLWLGPWLGRLWIAVAGG